MIGYILSKWHNVRQYHKRAKNGWLEHSKNKTKTTCLGSIRLYTIRAINTELRRRMPEKPHVHQRTICKHLAGMLFSYIKTIANTVPADHNRPDVIEGCHEYATVSGSNKRRIFITMFSLTTVDSIVGQPERKDGLPLDSDYIATCAVKRDATFHFAWWCLWSLAWCITPFRWVGWQGNLLQSLWQVRLPSLMKMTLISYSMGHQHRQQEQPRDNVQLRILPPHSPFLNIV